VFGGAEHHGVVWVRYPYGSSVNDGSIKLHSGWCWFRNLSAVIDEFITRKKVR